MQTTPAKMLLVFIDETDSWGATPLYEAVIRRLRQLGVAGATAATGIMGFGSHMSVHHKHLFGISDDKPVVIAAVDLAEKLHSVVPEIRAMIHEGLVVLIDVEVVPPAEDAR